MRRRFRPRTEPSQPSVTLQRLMTDLLSPAVEKETLKLTSVADVRATVRAGEAWPSRAPRTWRYAVLRRMLACADLVAGLLASLSLLIAGGGGAGHLAWSLVFLPAWILAAKLLGLYDRDESALRHLTVDEVPQLVLWALVGTSGISILLELTPAGHPNASSAISVGVVAAISAVPLRALARWAWRTLTPPERVALVGSKANADAFKRKLELFPDLHMTIVDERDLGRTATDPRWLDTVDRLVIAPTSLDDSRLTQLLGFSRAAGVMLTVVPSCQGVFGHALRVNHLAELSVLEYRKSDLPRSTLLLKRTLDIVIGTLTLVALSPLFAVIAVVVMLDSRGPVIFTQRRVGQNGRSFEIRKFRTMVQNAEELLPQLIRLDELPEPMFKLERDPRVTRVGRGLRRWSLDELPQLVNVVRGEMSLVGPRPEQVEFVDQYSPEQRLHLTVKPGLTGPMQVYGRGALGLEERLAVEHDYVENLSLGRDVRIVAMTVSTVIKGRGAF